MKKTISEELPERKHPPASGEMRDDRDEKRGKDPKDRVRQAVYDIRYRARREEIPLNQAFSQYMQNSSMSQQEKVLVKQKLLGKPGMKAEDFNIQDFASNNVANALYKVFVENFKNEEPITLTYMEKLETTEDRKYKVRVIGKDGRSYVRYATREKINSLRANPNIESVEMTEYGEPYEGERKRGEATAAVKSGKDWDGDGKVESGAKEYRGVVHNAIQRKKGGVPDGKDTSNVREDFIGEKKRVDNTTDESQKPVDVMTGSNNVTINPNVPGTEKNNVPGLQMAHHELDGPFIVEKSLSRAQQRFMGMVYVAKKGETPASPEVAKAAAGMSKKSARDFAKTKHKGLPVHKEESECEKGDSKERDTRGDYAKVSLLKNKLRAMGMKNPIVMTAGYEPEGELVIEWETFDEASAAAKRGLPEPHRRGKTPQRVSDAEASLEAVRKRQKSIKKYNKETGRQIDISQTKEGQQHAKKFPGSRQKPKPTPISATKDTPKAEEVRKKEHRERVSSANRRTGKYGLTKKQAATTDVIRSYGRLD